MDDRCIGRYYRWGDTLMASWDLTMWLDDIATIDYDDVGVPRLLWQYRGDQPRMQALLTSLLERLQSLEDVALEVLVGRWPLTAIGDQLDTVGKIVGQERGEQTDAQYRVYILAKILVNKSKGKASDIGYILTTMGVPTIDIIEHYPAEILVFACGIDDLENIGPFVAQAAPAGVAFHWVFSPEDADDVFAMSSTLGADEVDSDAGFGDLTGATQTSGGYFAGGHLA